MDVVDEQYLFEARQMQALSLAVHIPPACFGIAFPALVLFAEWRYLRTGDPLYRTLARRWSRSCWRCSRWAWSPGRSCPSS